MRSSFFEFNVAKSALFVARGGIDTTSHNISNASVVGYSRQIIEQRATKPLTYYNGRGMIGTGAEIFGIAQMRDTFLDSKYWTESSILGEFSIKNTLLQTTETILNEQQGTGLSTHFNNFFGGLQELSKDTSSATVRGDALSIMESMTTLMKHTYTQLQKQQRDANEEIKIVVNTINSLGQQIASLNKQIKLMEMDGSSANDLRDARALLVDKLSQYVNVDVSEVEKNVDYAAGKYPNPEDRGKSDKEFRVLINGHDFIKGDFSDSLVCKERTANGVSVSYNPEDTIGMYDIYWKVADSKFDMYSQNLKGELKGLIDIRDGNNGNYVNNLTVDNFTGPDTLTLTLPADARLDLSEGGGKITVYLNNGQRADYYYSSLTYNATNDEVELKMANASASDFYNLAPADIKNITLGETTDYKGIPYYMSRMNNLVRTFAMAVNYGQYIDGSPMDPNNPIGGHMNGYDLLGQQGENLLYTYINSAGVEADPNLTGYNIYKMTADNFQVNSKIMADPRLLAAAKEYPVGVDDNRVLFEFIDIKEDRSLFREGKLLDYIIGMSTELSIDRKQAKNFTASYTDVKATIDNQRMAYSGVDINEEITQMLIYQQQYQAASKLINVIDGIYDMTINRLGV